MIAWIILGKFFIRVVKILLTTTYLPPLSPPLVSVTIYRKIPGKVFLITSPWRVKNKFNLFVIIITNSGIFFLIYLFLIGGWLLCNVVLVSAIYQHEAAIGVRMFPPSWTSLPAPTPDSLCFWCSIFSNIPILNLILLHTCSTLCLKHFIFDKHSCFGDQGEAILILKALLGVTVPRIGSIIWIVTVSLHYHLRMFPEASLKINIFTKWNIFFLLVKKKSKVLL